MPASPEEQEAYFGALVSARQRLFGVIHLMNKGRAFFDADELGHHWVGRELATRRGRLVVMATEADPDGLHGEYDVAYEGYNDRGQTESRTHHKIDDIDMCELDEAGVPVAVLDADQVRNMSSSLGITAEELAAAS